ncbi:hypothetical protein, partial [Chryseobacterium oranimense]|uniref:hypothetical protein n=1 Tax=Chryseobacterium oranimense TaxID=421058 RepID=UPI001E46B1BA
LIRNILNLEKQGLKNYSHCNLNCLGSGVFNLGSMACNCKNIDFGSEENFAQQIMVDIPSHMEGYKQARFKEGLSDKICIDPCIIDEVKELWSLGIETHGCCCGHNKTESFVNVHEKDIEKMLSLGYVQNHPDKSRKDTFRLKSV